MIVSQPTAKSSMTTRSYAHVAEAVKEHSVGAAKCITHNLYTDMH